MFSKTHAHVTFFTDTANKSTEKMICGRVSEAIKTDRTGADGKAVYEYETWPARFVGNALEKAATLTDKTRITLTKYAARNPYSKERKRSYPYLLVMEFEVREPGVKAEGEENDFVPVEEEDGQLPF